MAYTTPFFKRIFMCRVSECLFEYIYVPVAFKGQKRALDPLGLELHMAVSCHVGAGTKVVSSARAISVLSPVPHTPLLTSDSEMVSPVLGEESPTVLLPAN